MKIIFAIFLIISFAGCSFNNNKSDQQVYEQNKKNLSEKEKADPLVFLKVSGNKEKNIIGQTVIKGTITNSATICSYKNVRIKMLCYQQEKMIIEHEDVVADLIQPNTTKEFKTKYRLPKGTDSVALFVMSATPEIKN